MAAMEIKSLSFSRAVRFMGAPSTWLSPSALPHARQRPAAERLDERDDVALQRAAVARERPDDEQAVPGASARNAFRALQHGAYGLKAGCGVGGGLDEH